MLVKKVLVLVLALVSACAGADTSVCTGTNKMWDPEAEDYSNMQAVLKSFPDVKMITRLVNYD